MLNLAKLTGEKIRELREAAGLTQKELATLMHRNDKFISRIERGQNIELSTLESIAKALNKIPRISFDDPNY